MNKRNDLVVKLIPKDVYNDEMLDPGDVAGVDDDIAERVEVLESTKADAPGFGFKAGTTINVGDAVPVLYLNPNATSIDLSAYDSKGIYLIRMRNDAGDSFSVFYYYGMLSFEPSYMEYPLDAPDIFEIFNDEINYDVTGKNMYVTAISEFTSQLFSIQGAPAPVVPASRRLGLLDLSRDRTYQEVLDAIIAAPRYHASNLTTYGISDTYRHGHLRQAGQGSSGSVSASYTGDFAELANRVSLSPSAQLNCRNYYGTGRITVFSSNDTNFTNVTNAPSDLPSTNMLHFDNLQGAGYNTRVITLSCAGSTSIWRATVTASGWSPWVKICTPAKTAIQGVPATAPTTALRGGVSYELWYGDKQLDPLRELVLDSSIAKPGDRFNFTLKIRSSSGGRFNLSVRLCNLGGEFVWYDTDGNRQTGNMNDIIGLYFYDELNDNEFTHHFSYYVDPVTGNMDMMEGEIEPQGAWILNFRLEFRNDTIQPGITINEYLNRLWKMEAITVTGQWA